MSAETLLEKEGKLSENVRLFCMQRETHFMNTPSAIFCEKIWSCMPDHKIIHFELLKSPGPP